MRMTLGEACHFYSGTGFPEMYQGVPDGEFPFFKVGDISANVSEGNTYLERCSNYISADVVTAIHGTIIPPDTVVFAKIGEALKKNRRAITTRESLVDNNAMGIAPRKELLRIRYFYYFMCRLQMERFAEATAVPSVRKSRLEQICLDVPSFEKQMYIENVLDAVSSVIKIRQRQLRALDTLIKARFVEMFGDPLNSKDEWPSIALCEACSSIFGGGTPSKSHPEYFTGTIPWVTPKDMKSGVIRDSIDHITEEAIANSTTNLVPINSVLMVIRSGILKHSLPVAINSVPVTINQDMKAFIPGKLILTEYLMHYFRAIESDVLAGVRGVTADNIDFKAFQQRSIIVPPIELQQQFAAFVSQVDKSKVATQKALYEAQLLFDSLMQKYFG